MKKSFLPFTCAFVIGIWAARLCPGPLWGLVFMCLFLTAISRRDESRMLSWLAFFLLGGWRGSVLFPPTSSNRHVSYPVRIAGVAATPAKPMRFGGGASFVLQWQHCLISIAGPFKTRVSAGDRISVTGLFKPYPAAERETSIMRYMANRLRGLTGRIQMSHPGQLHVRPGQAAWRQTLRTGVKGAIARVFPPRLQGLARALFLGERRAIPKSQRRAFVQAGTAHLLAISGLHVGLAAWGVYLVTLRLFALLLSGARLPPQKPALLASAAGAFGYAWLAGFSPSTLRAVVSVCLVTGLLWTGRRVQGISLAAAVVFFMLFQWPALLWSISFQLSACAVMGILRFGLSRPLPGLARQLIHETWAQRQFHRWVRKPLRISAGAFLGTLPVVLCHFGACHPWGPVANLAGCPLLMVVLLSGTMGLAGVMLAGPWLGCLLAWPAGLALDSLILCNETICRLPWHTVSVPAMPGPWAAASFFALLMPNPRRAVLFACVMMGLWVAASQLFPQPLS